MEREMFNPELMARNHGIANIGVLQRVIAYSAIASGGVGLLLITANGHALKKHEYIYLGAGAYTGSYRVTKVVSVNTFLVEGTFVATDAGNINLTVALDGYGFWVDAVVTIVEFIPEDPLDDAAAFIAASPTFPVRSYIHRPFKKMRITGGNATVVRQPIKAPLAYTNR